MCSYWTHHDVCKCRQGPINLCSTGFKPTLQYDYKWISYELHSCVFKVWEGFESNLIIQGVPCIMFLSMATFMGCLAAAGFLYSKVSMLTDMIEETPFSRKYMHCRMRLILTWKISFEKNVLNVCIRIPSLILIIHVTIQLITVITLVYIIAVSFSNLESLWNFAGIKNNLTSVSLPVFPKSSLRYQFHI